MSDPTWQLPFVAATPDVVDAVDSLAKKVKAHPPPLILKHTLLWLPIFVAASLAILIFSYLIPKVYRSLVRLVQRRRARRGQIFLDDSSSDLSSSADAYMHPLPSRGLLADFRAHVRTFREYGSVLFALEVVRTLCLATLLGLTIYAAIQAESPEEHTSDLLEELKKKKKHRNKRPPRVDDYSSLEWGEFGGVAFYAYTLLLSLLLLTLRPATPLRRHLMAHTDVLLLLAFSLYIYRDLWPSLTYYLVPSDLDNAITWSRIAILGVAAVVIPLVRPRTYVPVDPAHPTPEKDVHPEQTASLLSYWFYEYMTPLVWKAWKTPALPYDDLQPLADYDRAEHLYYSHAEQLDPVHRRRKGLPKRHLFWGLMSTFRKGYIITSIMCLLAAVAEIIPTIALNKILNYLETNGKGATIRPILWIILLFLGPAFASLTIQYYIFVQTRTLVRCESIMTQLLFDHALRLRMKDAPAEEDEAKGIPDDTPLIRIEEAIDHAPGAPAELLEESDMSGNGHGGIPDSEATEVGSAETDSNKNGNADGKKRADTEANKQKGQGLAGRINVLMAADIESLVEGRDLPLLTVFAPVQFAVCIYYLYSILSWSAFIGFLAMVATMPIPGLITKKNAVVQARRMKATDARVDTITEAVGALRIIKMFGWEERIKTRVAVKREDELTLIWQRRIMGLINTLLNTILPVLTLCVTLASYTILQKRELTAAIVFTSMTVFELMKGQLGLIFYMVNEMVTAWVSLKRLNEFMNEDDMIDAFLEPAEAHRPDGLREAEAEGVIRIHNATFSWGADASDFKLQVPDVTFPKGKISLIAGPTGSGKTSVLLSLIGELHFEAKPESYFHLPRLGGVSYAAQESWCSSDSIRDNILFGEPYEEERYNAVVHDCGLETDLKLFDDGDATEVGEKGITLSGGQKARITLARAIYSKTAVVLLDDVFSALDTLTSRFILDNLFRGSLVKDRTVLLVTHHISLAAPIADYMLVLHENGTVRSAGAIDDDMLSQAGESDIDAAEGQGSDGANKPVPAELKAEATKPVAKLVKAEEKSEGRISKRAMFSFFRMFGGPVFWSLYFGLLVAGHALSTFQNYWLGRWAHAYDEAADPRDVPVAFWLGSYVLVVLVSVAMFAGSAILYYIGAIKATREIHRKLVDHIFGAYQRFLDSTPVGRIISRFTKDMKAIDGAFTEVFANVVDITLGMAIKLVVVVSFVPLFSIPAVVIGALGGILGELYIHGQLSVKREMSNAKSPLFSHFAAAVSGIVSIRAYAAQEKMRVEARKRADKYTRAATAFYNLNRWVTVFLVYGPRLGASTSGFALSQAISFSGTILWWVRMVNELEVQGNSVERIEDYLIIDQEPESVESKKPPASWPTSGSIVLDKLSAKYAHDGPTVLDNLEVSIQSGEKVGIVGRTGSGKSTLALAILRMLPTTGSVIIDGIDTQKINLHDLRSNVTIIPQDPILLSGSLRFNLDPFGDHDDATLNDALQRSGLGASRRSESGAATPQRLGLDTAITAGGSNLSQGQRQLVALARALVRDSKVLILDEATASVDFETDALIQRSIRSLPQSTTVLTVAHRLSTVMDYDKILVLGAGKVLEYDSPESLKKNQDSYFAKLVRAMEA
ncbi:hypothetical protein Q5752_006404 [Cryptotrichosporon argae]